LEEAAAQTLEEAEAQTLEAAAEVVEAMEKQYLDLCFRMDGLPGR
jgi:hypothetical protein